MSAEQEIRFKNLQAKNQKVTEGALKVNAQIEHARETVSRLKEAGQKKFGESDLEKLKEMLKLWDQENININDRIETGVNEKFNEVQMKSELIRQAQQKYQKN